jgi:hypothetical protein
VCKAEQQLSLVINHRELNTSNVHTRVPVSLPQAVIAACKQQTWVTTLAGRRRHLPHIHETGKGGSNARARAERQAVNTVCQVCCRAQHSAAQCVTLARHPAGFAGIGGRAHMMKAVAIEQWCRHQRTVLCAAR